MKNVIILGATSGIALEVQRQLASRGCELLLVARAPERLAALQSDLLVRGASQVIVPDRYAYLSPQILDFDLYLVRFRAFQSIHSASRTIR